MSSCYDGSFLCQNPTYVDFDEIASKELLTPPSAFEIVNESKFCTLVPLDEAFLLSDLTHKDYLKGLRGKTGIYQLWINYENCTDHDTYVMHCVYVGKGLAETRVNRHIKDKWPKAEELYVTFYECTNRMAKYLEQLFLDTYNFYLNNNENTGANSLFAVWGNERHLLGTELHEISNLSNITSLEELLNL
ncbi:hypothetical protein O0882_08090 [Janthinobacterium sp. SUN073]|uniref:hypothetical protein n=1 Tax=Janthinobacterium sp. SUN073 TaxID=3004102 RepID=UPI0025AFF16A|nr:hypothetical protein [Janthinobacterium sp. SUN073]MDN2696272.1 hypothetical protein [Janthinobacterium sp. SUN073]